LSPSHPAHILRIWKFNHWNFLPTVNVQRHYTVYNIVSSLNKHFLLSVFLFLNLSIFLSTKNSKKNRQQPTKQANKQYNAIYCPSINNLLPSDKKLQSMYSFHLALSLTKNMHIWKNYYHFALCSVFLTVNNYGRSDSSPSAIVVYVYTSKKKNITNMAITVVFINSDKELFAPSKCTSRQKSSLHSSSWNEYS
jgi:hypothetical protein